MAGIMTKKKATAKKAVAKTTPNKMYILWDKAGNWQVGPKFLSEKSAMDYVEKNGFLNVDYEIFSCEKILKTNTRQKPVWVVA